MGEVTAQLVDDVTKEDLSSQPLLHPLLMIMSPPPPFLPVPGQPSMFWQKWVKVFEQYVDALGESDLVDSSKCLLLRNCLGQEGQRIFTSLVQGESSYAAAVSLLTLYFGSDHASQTCLLKFHQRAQMPGESVGQFVSALERLLRPCNLGHLEESLLVNQLILKTNCPQVKERLRTEKEALSLAAALLLATEAESAANRAQLSDNYGISVNIGDNSELPVRKAKRGRPRRGEERSKPKPILTENFKLSRYKCNYYYNKLYHREDGGCPSKAGADSSTKDAGNDGSSQVKEEDLDNTRDGGGDQDFTAGQRELRGPFCPICTGKRFRDANKLARHMRTHTKEKPFSCPLCPLTFSQSYHMTRHLRNQHGAGQHVCTTCGKNLGSSAELQSHKKTHPSKVLSSPDSREELENKGAFLSHVVSRSKYRSTQTDGPGPRTRHEVKNQVSESVDTENGEIGDVMDDAAEKEPGDGDSAEDKDEGLDTNVERDEKDSEGRSHDDGEKKTETKGHFCPICVSRSFRGAKKLARHMRMHTKEKPFSCPVCALTFSQSYHMTRHLRRQHGLGQYICAQCGKGLGSWLELKDHKKTHTAEGPVCEKLKDKSAGASELQSHRKENKSSPRSLSCSDCGKVFSRLYHLKRHIVSHRKATNGECYTCPVCQKTYAFQEDLDKHLEVHVKENSGTCPKCNRRFSRPEELETHMAVHEKSYVCGTCGKKFKVEYALKKHEQGHRDEQYYCTLCRKHFIKLSHYKRHIQVHDRRESKCPHCDSVFLKVTALKYHLRTHTEERPYQCSCCVETFEEEEHLEKHRLKHRKFKKERPYSCTRCDAAFSTLVELTEHMGSHVGEQPLSCPVCAKTFLNKKKLEKHLSIHTGERPHLCFLCGNGFPSAASLKLHSHIHTGEKPFQCSQCSKSFRSSSGLRLHRRQHMEVRPSFECPECGRTYGRMTELKMHQRYHTGDKPYACTCCAKRFISNDKLKVHMRIHTGERPYSCPHCGQAFTQTGDRNRHISKHHSEAS